MDKLSAAEKRWMEKFGKEFGADTLEMGVEVTPYEVVSTGSLTLDYALSVGGLVEGRLAEYWGPDGIGKSTLALLAVAEAQRKHPKKRGAWIDMEHKLDRPWAMAHGVDMDRFTVYTPDNAEDVADAMKEIIRSGFHSIVVLDSIGGMIPEKEKEKDAGDAVVGTAAKIITRMVKIAATEAEKTGIIPIFINQIRANIGSYGADTTTGGGWALKYSTTMKFKFRRTGTNPYTVTMGGEKRTVGHEIAITVERNGVAPAYRTAIINLFHVATPTYGPIGVDKVDEAVTLGLKLGLIQQDGAWYTEPINGERFQGKEKLVAALRFQPGIVEELRRRVLATVAEEVHEEIPPEDIPDEPPEDAPRMEDTQPRTSVMKPVKKAAKAKKATKKKPAFRKGARAADPELQR